MESLCTEENMDRHHRRRRRQRRRRTLHSDDDSSAPTIYRAARSDLDRSVYDDVDVNRTDIIDHRCRDFECLRRVNDGNGGGRVWQPPPYNDRKTKKTTDDDDDDDDRRATTTVTACFCFLRRVVTFIWINVLLELTLNTCSRRQRRRRRRGTLRTILDVLFLGRRRRPWLRCLTTTTTTTTTSSWPNNMFAPLTTLAVFASTVLRLADACSSRSTPKPRPPSPTIRPNITFPTSVCPPNYDTWYCLNGATCFTVEISESVLYNCVCADGYTGPRCEFKDLDGSYLPSRDRIMVERASIAGGVTVAVLLIVIISIAFYIYSRRRKKEKNLTVTDGIDVRPRHFRSHRLSQQAGGGHCVRSIYHQDLESGVASNLRRDPVSLDEPHDDVTAVSTFHNQRGGGGP